MPSQRVRHHHHCPGPRRWSVRELSLPISQGKKEMQLLDRLPLQHPHFLHTTTQAVGSPRTSIAPISLFGSYADSSREHRCSMITWHNVEQQVFRSEKGNVLWAKSRTAREIRRRL